MCSKVIKVDSFETFQKIFLSVGFDLVVSLLLTMWGGGGGESFYIFEKDM